jgi:tetratricopeptide (TPR) repeat protein
VGLSGEGDAGGDRRDEAFAAWRRFFEALAERRPLVLVFEDLHWADDHLLDFVDYLVEWVTDSPLLVIATARPELLERRPGWGGGKPNAATVSLSPLSEEEIARLLASLLDQPVMPAEMQAPLLARAGGNPLYAEEYARMVSERGVAPTEDSPLPENVQGIVAARLDGLSAEDKTLIQDAAVLGKVFWSGALATMNGLQRWTVEESLHRLERKEFVRRERRSSVAAETEYAFRHVLVRDVAYSQVPRALRAEKHRLAAEWIEALSADREDRAEMLAHHYLSALEFARAAGQEVESIAERARVALSEAGDRAYSLNASGAAAEFYRGAIELSTADHPERGHLLARYGRSLVLSDWRSDAVGILGEACDRLLATGEREEAAEAVVTLGTLHWYRGERDRAVPRFEHAAALIEDAAPSSSKAAVLSEVARFAMLGDEDAKALDLGREALAMAEEFGLDEVAARTLNTLGVSRVKLGDRGGLADIERALEMTESGSPERTRGFINLASTLGELGEFRRSIELHEEGLSEAERLGAPGPVRWLRAERIWDEYLTGRWNEAAEHVEEYLADAETRERHYMDVAVWEVRALIRLGRGDEAGALADSGHALDLGRAAQDPQVLNPVLAFKSLILIASGRRAEAVPFVDELLALLRSSSSGFLSYWATALAVVLTELGREGELETIVESATVSTRWLDAARTYASGAFGEAADVYAEIGSVPDEAFARLRAAEALVAAGRRPEADAQLQRALTFYRSVGATAYIREAESLFAASA